MKTQSGKKNPVVLAPPPSLSWMKRNKINIKNKKQDASPAKPFESKFKNLVQLSAATLDETKKGKLKVKKKLVPAPSLSWMERK